MYFCIIILFLYSFYNYTSMQLIYSVILCIFLYPFKSDRGRVSGSPNSSRGFMAQKRQRAHAGVMSLTGLSVEVESWP